MEYERVKREEVKEGDRVIVLSLSSTPLIYEVVSIGREGVVAMSIDGKYGSFVRFEDLIVVREEGILIGERVAKKSGLELLS